MYKALACQSVFLLLGRDSGFSPKYNSVLNNLLQFPSVLSNSWLSYFCWIGGVNLWKEIASADRTEPDKFHQAVCILAGLAIINVDSPRSRIPYHWCSSFTSPSPPKILAFSFPATSSAFIGIAQALSWKLLLCFSFNNLLQVLPCVTLM